MTEEELAKMIGLLRQAGTDTTHVEVKSARNEFPRRLGEDVSGFANTSGGYIVLGVDENSGFKAVGIADPRTMQDKVEGLCRDNIVPPLQPAVEFHTFEGELLIIIEIEALEAAQKPCFYRSKQGNWAYRRVGDGNHRMSQYEINQLYAARGQPRDDVQPVLGASLAELDAEAVQLFLHRLRQTRRLFSNEDDHDILQRVGVLVIDPNDAKGLVPSVAGLLTFASRPQNFFPQLNITFVRYHDAQGPTPGERFAESRSLEGPLPTIIVDAVEAVRGSAFRKEVTVAADPPESWDPPREALREAITNALVHRDYGVQSTPVRIEEYPDRLVIRNPGGLFGPVACGDLGEPGISSSRNATLIRLLEDVMFPDSHHRVCENRGSGIGVMARDMAAAGLMPPEPLDDVGTFTLTFPKHTLMDAEALAWVAALGLDDLSESQQQALVLLRGGDPLTASGYRQRFLLSSSKAMAKLDDLVEKGLARKEGYGRKTSYRLADDLADQGEDPEFVLAQEGPRRVLELVDTYTLAAPDQLARALDADEATIRACLHILRQAAPPLVARIDSNTEPDARYRLTPAGRGALPSEYDQTDEKTEEIWP